MMIERRSAPRPCRAAWEGKGSIAVHTRVVLAGRWMLAGIALLFAGEAFSATQTVQWQGLAASEGSIAGYRLYLGPVSGIYTTVFDLGLPTADGAGEFEAWVDVPEGEVFYAVIASYGEEGGEKTRSSEIILGGPTDVSARPLPQDGIDSSQEQDRRWPITVAPLQAMGATRGTGRMLTAPSGDPRLFVVEREGAVRIVEGGLQRGVPFLDLDDQTAWVDGGGLISLAFDPDYAQNGHFFVTHTSPEGEFILTRFSVSRDPYEADPFSGVEILSLLLPYRGNPGGGLAFDADGYLLVAIGDGGGEGDPADLAQDGEVLLGKVLRLDVADRRRPDSVPSREGPYALPADNPFLDDETVRDEIWAFGLRDPGHLSVDSRTGDLWIADRGGRSRHEVDWEPGDTAGGHNYAWDVAEGTQCQVAGSARRCTSTEWTDPVVEYAVTETHCGVVGGFAYRGVLPERQGEYFFMDGCTGQFWSYDREAEAFADWSRVFSGSELGDIHAVAMGEGGMGEVFLVGSDSGIYKLGSGVPECSDGLDNDQDGLIDHPDDPGCVAPSSLLEIALCDDGFDNDGDGTVDIDDSECTAGHRNTEARSALLTDLTSEPACGLGAEFVLLLPILIRLRRALT